MSLNVMIEPVNNGWVTKLYDPEYEEDPNTDETHVFTDVQEMLDWLSQVLQQTE